MGLGNSATYSGQKVKDLPLPSHRRWKNEVKIHHIFDGSQPPRLKSVVLSANL